MKKVLVFMLCFLAVFAIVSCKQDPKEPVKDDAYVLTVRPAVADPDDPESTIDWGTQTGKCQFTLATAVAAGESIEFLAKVSSDVTKIDVRMGANPFTTWKSFVVDECEKTDDGWLIISIDEETVSAGAEKIGITLRVPQNPNIFCSIKDLKIDGEAVDFEEIVAAEYATAMDGALCPTRVSAVVSKEN